MQRNGNDSSRNLSSFGDQPVLSITMVLAVVLGLVFMIIGLPAIGGVCLVVAFVCALTVVLKAMAEKYHQ